MAPRKKFRRFTTKTKDTLDDEIKLLSEMCHQFDNTPSRTFSEYPISEKTRSGLKAAGYTKPTEIQRDSILYALKGEDVLGAAKTGSGKTLAFVVPVLEALYRNKWSHHDGLGALIISPTRELAMQICDVFKKVSNHHRYTIGDIVGGKDLKYERKRMDKYNIIICTPGRLLQHMETNCLFTCDNLQILVLDEADQILDLGFQQAINAIIEYLPSERQTLLFSATQTKSVRDLARLSLKNPVYVSAHEHSEYSTPEGLKQMYYVCHAQDKINTLWAFLKDHPKEKILVFMASCKQVKFMHTAFCRMRPQSSIFALSSKMHQTKRMETYQNFYRKQNAVLFATDIAARGLDFPGVHWVLQLDCPQDAKTYIHRVGRTARYEKGGQSIILLLPSEENAVLEQIQQKKIPISKLEFLKRVNVRPKLAVFLSRDVNLKESAQRAFVAYFKSIFLMKNKKIFDVHKLNKEEYAKSLGLIQPPRIRFLQAAEKRQNKSHLITETAKEKNQDFGQSDESDDELFSVKKTTLADDLPEVEEPVRKSKIITKAALAKRELKHKVKPNTKKMFDEEGQVVAQFPNRQATSHDDDEQDFTDGIGGINIEKSKAILFAEDRVDKEIFRQKIKAKHKEKRLKEKAMKRKREETDEEIEDPEQVAQLETETKVKKKKKMNDKETSLEKQEELAMQILSQNWN